MSQAVAHARDLDPGDGGLGPEHLGGQGLHCFPDFKQSDPDGVEYQTVGQVTSLQVRADGVDRRLNVGQPLLFPVGHSATRSRSARARTAGLRSLRAGDGTGGSVLIT